MFTWTVVNIGLWGKSPTGRTRCHTSIHVLGEVPEGEAIAQARERITRSWDPLNLKQALLACLDAGNYSITMETT